MADDRICCFRGNVSIEEPIFAQTLKALQDQARDRPRLQLPEGVTGSERLSGGMVIPAAAPDPAQLDPAPKCLDQPPPYFGQKAVMAGSAEEAVYVWAAAWSNRKPDQVAAFYSPQFQAAEKGGAAAYIEERKEQVAHCIRILRRRTTLQSRGTSV